MLSKAPFESMLLRKPKPNNKGCSQVEERDLNKPMMETPTHLETEFVRPERRSIS